MAVSFDGIIRVPLINPDSQSSCIHRNHLDSPLPCAFTIMNIPPNLCWGKVCRDTVLSCFELIADPGILGRTFWFSTWQSLYIGSISPELSLHHASWPLSFVTCLVSHLYSTLQCDPALHTRTTMLGQRIGLGCLLVHSFYKSLLLAECKKDTVFEGDRDDRCQSLIHSERNPQMTIHDK